MTYSNYPSAAPTEPEVPKKKDNRNLIYGILIAALVGSWGYLIYEKNNHKQEIIKITEESKSKDTIIVDYKSSAEDALARLDQLKGQNSKLDSLLQQDDLQIQKLRNQISSLASKQKRTELENKQLKNLVTELNAKMDNYVLEITRLKNENLQLTVEKDAVTTERNQLASENEQLNAEKSKLEEKVDVASTLIASNINLVAIQEKGNGKEKETDKAKKADKLKVTFNVNNRVASSGSKDIYIIISDPSGNVVTSSDLGSGSFNTREEGEKTFTEKKSINFSSGQNVSVEVQWKPGAKFQVGNYKIAIYNNGYKIGEATKELKKSTFLGL